MTGKADFTDEEWKLVLQGPTSAGTHVMIASRGGTFRETMGMAKAYTDARSQAGASELLDIIVSTKPEMDRTRASSKEEMEANQLEHVQNAMALVREKATREEAEAYRTFIAGLAERVAEAHKDVTDEERKAIDEVAAALGG